MWENNAASRARGVKKSSIGRVGALSRNWFFCVMVGALMVSSGGQSDTIWKNLSPRLVV